MEKREFLEGSETSIAGGAPTCAQIEGRDGVRTNWSGNYVYSSNRLLEPPSLEEVQAIVASGTRLKALGSRHSFSGVADTTGDQISLTRLKTMALDAESRTVTVGAGVRYGELAPFLEERGFALHNLASLPHITIVGACATGTHGSGSRNGCLSTAISELEMVTGDGQAVTLSREGDGARFRAAVVGLGALGVVTRVSLEVEPTFQMKQVVYENLSMTQLESHLEEIFASGYSVSLFTDWQDHRMTQVWIKSRLEPGASVSAEPEFFGAKLAKQDLHPLAGHSAENCTEQMGVPGPWYERMPHFRMNYTPSSGSELQTEYFVAREKGYEAILAIEELRDEIAPHLFVCEIRTIAADDLWMSMAYGRDSMAMHFTWKPDCKVLASLLPKMEAKLKPFDARPHWAKVFTMDPVRLREVTPMMREFEREMERYDPCGKFRNAFLEKNVYRS